MKLKVLLTGAGAPGMPGILRCLRAVKERELWLAGADMDESAPSRKAFDIFYKIPPAQDDNFIDAVLKICIDEKLDIVIPCVTRELEKFSFAKQQFKENGIIVAVPDPEILINANNKGMLLTEMKNAGMRVPIFYIVSNAEEAREAIKMIGYPATGFCIKALTGNGSRAVRLIDPAISKSRLFFNEKPNGIYCSISNLEDIFYETPVFPQKMMVMQLLKGAEFSTDIVARNGDVLAAVVRQGLSVVSSNQTSSKVVDRPDLLKYCSDVVQLMDLSGNIGFDIKCDETGIPYIIEINPRLTGGIVTCFAAGANMPWLGVKSWLGLPVTQPPIRYGVRMQRFWNERFYDESDNMLEI